MLEYTAAPLDVDVVILDEAQDLSTLQWDYAYKVLFHAKRIYIAGDDDQAIFQWSGADVYSFQNIGGDTQVLQQSHRIPGAVHEIAERIVTRIKGRYPKTYKPKAEQGVIRRYQSVEDLDLRTPGTWLLLARNVFMLESLVSLVRDEGLPYCYRGESAIDRSHIKAIWAWTQYNQGRTMSPDELTLVRSLLPKKVPMEKLRGRIWHEVLTGIKVEEREWYVGMLRRGEKLGATPRININTVHGVKGGEADHVALMTDMSNRTWQSYETDPDSEHRVFYVGATRAKQGLHIIQPQTQRGYEI
jgi:superfamily I DNA/RNA helicase